MKHEDIILDSIWAEMQQANTNVYYAEFLIDRHLKRNKIYNSFIACFSVGGVGLSFVDEIFPTLACAILAVTEITKAFFPCLMMKPDDIAKLSSLSIKYDNYFFIQKRLFDNLFCDKIDSTKAEKEYHGTINGNSANKNEISKLFGEIDLKLNKKAAQKSETYLNKIYHGKENNSSTTVTG